MPKIEKQVRYTKEEIISLLQKQIYPEKVKSAKMHSRGITLFLE